MIPKSGEPVFGKIMRQHQAGALVLARAILYKAASPPIVTRWTKAVPRGFVGD
jgi:hypothetical protein